MEELAIPLVARHPAVTRVELAGSRARGTHEELSDWDFAVTTPDFAAVARAMPDLVAPLEPLGEQWEPMGHFPVYQVLLRGPVKVEYLFLDERQEAAPPVTPSAETLVAIDNHFWDWIWWIATKASIGRDDLVAEHLPQLHAHLLRPLGVRAVPRDINAAIRAFVARRAGYDVAVPRELEAEVRRGIARLGLAEQHAPARAMSDAGEIARFYDRCSELMRALLDELAEAPDRPRTFPEIEDSIGWPHRRIASVLGGVSRLRNTEFGGRRPYRFLDERRSASGRWEMWMDAGQASAVREARA
jgi:predicted nucleotidyltransferase